MSGYGQSTGMGRPHAHVCMQAQDALSTTAAFPYGQLGAAMPVAVALALFANVNMAFGRGVPAPASSDGAPAHLQPSITCSPV